MENLSNAESTTEVEVTEKDVAFADPGEFFGTLQQSVVVAWRAHLAASKHSVHTITEEFYDEMIDKTDELIECYQGLYGKVKSYKNKIAYFVDIVTYLENLRDCTREGREMFCNTTELESCCDDILTLINTTLYKLKELAS